MERRADDALRNLREWVVLLFALFLALDIAGVQYGLHLSQIAATEPNVAAGQIAALIRSDHGDSYSVYVRPDQLAAFYGFLAGSAAALLATLGLIVAHGIKLASAERKQRRRHVH